MGGICVWDVQTNVHFGGEPHRWTLWRPVRKFGGLDRANLEAMIKLVWRCTSRPVLIEFSVATLKLYYTEFGHSVEAHDSVRLMT